MSTTDSKATLLDALADTGVEVLAMFTAHLRDKSYADATECLSAVRSITHDCVHLEDHVFGREEDRKAVNVDNSGIATPLRAVA